MWSTTASATGEPRCGVPIVTSVLTRSAASGTFDKTYRASSPPMLCAITCSFSSELSDLKDCGRQLLAARRDASDRIHLRGDDDVALRSQVSGDAVKVVDQGRHAGESSESQNAMRENDRVLCHRSVSRTFDIRNLGP